MPTTARPSDRRTGMVRSRREAASGELSDRPGGSAERHSPYGDTRPLSVHQGHARLTCTSPTGGLTPQIPGPVSTAIRRLGSTGRARDASTAPGKEVSPVRPSARDRVAVVKANGGVEWRAEEAEDGERLRSPTNTRGPAT